MAIRIICRRPGFRRAGVAHRADRTWPVGSFTKEQMEQLRAEPLLTVVEVTDEASNDGTGGSAGGAGSPSSETVASQAGQPGKGSEAGDAQTGADPSQTPTNTEGAPGIAPGTPDGTAGSQTGASRNDGSNSGSSQSDEAGKGAEGNSTVPSASATNPKPKGRAPSGRR